MHRFFLPLNAFQGEAVLFPPETARQIQRVLRLHAGDSVICLDNQRWEYRVELSPGESSGRILEKNLASGEPAVRLHMLLCLSQREKFEGMLQKCTEVGAAEFTPVLSSRSLVQDAHSLQNKYPRWEKILQEAAEQSGRGNIPHLNRSVGYEASLKNTAAGGGLCLLAWEGEVAQRLTDALSRQARNAAVAVLIGPEGGLSEAEVELAAGAGWKPVSLGRRILRMETAAVVAAALTVDWFDSQPG